MTEIKLENPKIFKIKKAVKKYGLIAFVTYLVATSFFTAMYFSGQRLQIKVGSFTLVK